MSFVATVPRGMIPVVEVETGGNSLTPLGRGLMIPLMISEHALWPWKTAHGVSRASFCLGTRL